MLFLSLMALQLPHELLRRFSIGPFASHKLKLFAGFLISVVSVPATRTAPSSAELSKNAAYGPGERRLGATQVLPTERRDSQIVKRYSMDPSSTPVETE